MPPKAKKTCKQFLRDGSKLALCGTVFEGFVCSNSENHLLPFPTGYCANGWHEGIKPVDWRGNPAPSCRFYQTCPCKCHTDVAKIFEMSGMERVLMDKSEYTHPPRTFWLPSDDPVTWKTDPSSAVPTVTPVLLESPAPDRVPATLARSFGPTATGRAARGELELWVKQTCDVWLIEEYAFKCTPAWIADEIATDKGIKPPSVGAINSVFDRWSKLGFAYIEKHPTQFIRYTEQGIKIGLEGLKARAKRTKQLAEAEKKRGLVR